MKKIILVSVGVVLISAGAIDYLLGALMPHGRIIILLGAIAIAAASFIHGSQRQKRQEKNALPFLGVAVSPLDAVLTPPDKWEVQQWNPHAVTGAEVWGVILIIVLVGLLVYWGQSSIKKSNARIKEGVID
jgi:hypothetical protein